jgi:hypothetical protein
MTEQHRRPADDFGGSRGAPSLGGVVMTDPQPSGDYGYDLVHEDVRAPRRSSDHPGNDARRKPVPPGRADRGEDLGYDEAHDF